MVHNDFSSFSNLKALVEAGHEQKSFEEIMLFFAYCVSAFLFKVYDRHLNRLVASWRPPLEPCFWWGQKSIARKRLDNLLRNMTLHERGPAAEGDNDELEVWDLVEATFQTWIACLHWWEHVKVDWSMEHPELYVLPRKPCPSRQEWHMVWHPCLA